MARAALHRLLLAFPAGTARLAVTALRNRLAAVPQGRALPALDGADSVAVN